VIAGMQRPFFLERLFLRPDSSSFRNMDECSRQNSSHEFGAAAAALDHGAFAAHSVINQSHPIAAVQCYAAIEVRKLH